MGGRLFFQRARRPFVPADSVPGAPPATLPLSARRQISRRAEIERLMAAARKSSRYGHRTQP
jgi:hypothetical protein